MDDFPRKECPIHGLYMAHLDDCPVCQRTTISYPVSRAEVVDSIQRGGTIVKEEKKISPLEADFMREWALTGLPMPVSEYRFCMTRRWRADFAWPDKMLLVELEGGLYGNGRHNRALGYIADLEKYNYATELGYRLLRYHQVTEEAIAQVRRVYESL